MVLRWSSAGRVRSDQVDRDTCFHRQASDQRRFRPARRPRIDHPQAWIFRRGGRPQRVAGGPEQAAGRTMSESSLILVVDDNDAGLLLTCAVLQLDGFRVDSASSSQEVLERLRARRPDLILMDVQMLGQDGLSLTRQLKADPATVTIPIVALTAHAMSAARGLHLTSVCS